MSASGSIPLSRVHHDGSAGGAFSHLFSVPVVTLRRYRLGGRFSGSSWTARAAAMMTKLLHQQPPAAAGDGQPQ